MAGDTVDGCIPSKIVQEDMEVGQEGGVAGQFNISQDLNSQPATQPLDASFDCESQSQGCEEGVWGQLYPHCGTFPRIALRQDSYKLGRAATCDYVIRESDMGTHRWLTAVSKCQCEIVRNKQGVFLKDRSSNGTWVNGNKVGKDCMWPLDHNAEICFAGANKKVFVFMSNEAQTDIFPSSLTSKYTVSKVLGRGATGEVRLGFRIPDLHRVAIKIICKRTTSTISSKEASQVLNEVRILQSVSHPCVINLEDVIDTPDYLFIVLELAEGGELFDKIIERTKFNEVEAKLHFYQIASAIKYLHAKNICHRDLKPENVLLCTVDDSNPVVKITDMGLSKLVDLGTVLKTFCGTPQYIAPEVVTSAGLMDSSYTLKVDCWSLGVILYILLSGTPPFSEDRQCGLNLRAQILAANYQFYPQLFDTISSTAKDLIARLLKVSPEERISAEEILLHPWLQDTQIVRRATALMATQLRGKKRLVEEIEAEPVPDKRSRVGESMSVFRTPQLGVGGIFDPPT
eukprot:GFUD01119867.1.p1 GENE.GFUD01119867.1~~GFUD01119867.1.p1  ORF type:complete len:515 (-),score=128.52 GFUD01119867.1:119-1663(-)